MLLNICFGFMMFIASLVELPIAKTRMRQEHNSQIANFDMASLRVMGPASSSCVPRFIHTQGRIDITERKRRNTNAHQSQACHVKLLCNRLFRSVCYGRGEGEVELTIPPQRFWPHFTS